MILKYPVERNGNKSLTVIVYLLHPDGSDVGLDSREKTAQTVPQCQDVNEDLVINHLIAIAIKDGKDSFVQYVS